MIVAASFDTNDPARWVNRAMQYGDGVFETMRMSAGQIGCWAWHLSRLQQGVSVLQLTDIDLAHITQQLTDFGQQHDSHDWVVKLMVFRAAQQRSYQPMTAQADWLITAEPMLDQPVHQPLQLAVAQRRLSHQPDLAGLKHLSRLEQVLVASELAEHPDADDLLVLDQQGLVIETTYQNVVLIQQQRLYTPKLDKCGVAGVALQWLKSHHHVTERAISLAELAEFDGMMVSNAIRGFRLVKAINRVNSFGTSHDIHDKISHQWAVVNHS